MSAKKFGIAAVSVAAVYVGYRSDYMRKYRSEYPPQLYDHLKYSLYLKHKIMADPSLDNNDDMKQQWTDSMKYTVDLARKLAQDQHNTQSSSFSPSRLFAKSKVLSRQSTAYVGLLIEAAETSQLLEIQSPDSNDNKIDAEQLYTEASNILYEQIADIRQKASDQKDLQLIEQLIEVTLKQNDLYEAKHLHDKGETMINERLSQIMRIVQSRQIKLSELTESLSTCIERLGHLQMQQQKYDEAIMTYSGMSQLITTQLPQNQTSALYCMLAHAQNQVAVCLYERSRIVSRIDEAQKLLKDSHRMLEEAKQSHQNGIELLQQERLMMNCMRQSVLNMVQTSKSRLTSEEICNECDKSISQNLRLVKGATKIR
ncbi:hypothetical protein MP228_006846 [Amoeboaphelidium protococcarum]|nr:hypothetical protein MP228_006846 [Amoeboaphelidium protococcarum]